MLLQLGIYAFFEVGVRFNAIDVTDKRGVITMNLIAWPRAKFENNATNSLYK